MNIDELKDFCDKFYGMVRNLHQFSEQEVRGVLAGQLNPSWAERFRLNCFFRSEANVHSLLKLQEGKDGQAVAMIARTLLELSIEAEIIGKVLGAEIKTIAFTDLEKLARAQAQVKWEKENGHPVSQNSEEYIAHNLDRVESLKASIWPETKGLMHWSGKTLAQRADLAGPKYKQLYIRHYKVRSWYVHAGYVGFQDQSEDFFLAMLADSFLCASECYKETLSTMIESFELYRVDEKIRDKLIFAERVAFTSPGKQAQRLWDEMIG